MLDVSTTHPFEACVAFAMKWLDRIAAYDLAGAEALIDINESGAPFAESFPRPEGFTYCHPEHVANWTMYVLNASEDGLRFEFELPFVERNYRPMEARFHMKRIGDRLEVRFEAIVPS